jgi:hypothetical protein
MSRGVTVGPGLRGEGISPRASHLRGCDPRRWCPGTTPTRRPTPPGSSDRSSPSFAPPWPERRRDRDTQRRRVRSRRRRRGATGYVGDRIGRRNSLILGRFAAVASLLGFAVVTDVVGFLVPYALLALTFTFASGAGGVALRDPPRAARHRRVHPGPGARPGDRVVGDGRDDGRLGVPLRRRPGVAVRRGRARGAPERRGPPDDARVRGRRANARPPRGGPGRSRGARRPGVRSFVVHVRSTGS